MEWTIFLIISTLGLFSSVVFSFVRANGKYKRGRMLDPSKILLIGVVVSAVLLFIPLYINAFESNDCGVIETLLIAIHNMIRLFVVDGEFEFIITKLVGVPTLVSKGYIVMFAILFVMAPVLTFGFVLSFFKNISAYKRYIMHYNSNVYIFSELNEKSLALAESLYKNNSKVRFFVFTDVSEREGMQSYEYVEKAKEIGAVCFRKDVLAVNFLFHNKNSELNFLP